jgi:arabinose-5-phosphate isomerase
MFPGARRRAESRLPSKASSSQPLAANPARAANHLLEATRRAIQALEGSWDEAAVRSWTRHLIESRGRLVLTGMGKSGLVAQKIAATLASTGCPSFYLHPADALHGDLGMVMAEDTVLVLSNSGESEEIVRLLPNLLRLGVKIGAITARPDSRLAQAANWCFTYELPGGEGCPLNFAPMASTTLQLVWGDLLAAYHMEESGFTLERFASNHPAGNIGARLLKVKELIHDDFPRVAPTADLVETLGTMTRGKMGMTTVLESGRLLGIISDGDIRRALEGAQKMRSNPLSLTAGHMMTVKPVCIAPDTLAAEAARIMESRKITSLVVLDGDQPCGVIHIHDLFAAKVI